MRKYIPLKDKKGLIKVNCPYKISTLYKYRCLGAYPRLTAKIGRVVCLNVEELQRMAKRSIRVQEAKAEKLMKRVSSSAKAGEGRALSLQ